jgi:hypothetical protein
LRPGIEWLEERLMLDSCPPSILIGRTLSEYFAGGVTNSQETITYTVYNEQPDAETGVLLATTLEPGVTLASASQPPDQSGQNLAWSLGTIGGFDRATVTLTVALASPVPAQLDSGARAFAILDGAAVSDAAPAAALRPGSLADPGLLASTPDASTTDPFIQEEAARLDYDPQQIFDFLHTQIGYESYAGSVRGARGTLWSGAGNAIDVASLGVALMRAAGIPAQYVQGTVSTAQAQQLIVSIFPAQIQTLGFIPAGTNTSDPANDPQLLAETTSHAWFQFDTGSGMTDADPLVPGASVGQAFTPPTGTFAEVPDGLREKTEVELVAEITAQGILGATQGQTTVLDRTWSDVALVGHPATFGNFVSNQSAGSIITATTNTYTPYVSVGDDASPNPAQDDTTTGTPYQEIFSNFALVSRVVTGLFLDVTLSGPQGAAQTFTKTLFDRIGYDVRQGGGPVSNISASASGPPAFSPFQTWTLSVLAGAQDGRTGALNQTSVLAQADAVDQQLASGATGNAEVTLAQARQLLFQQPFRQPIRRLLRRGHQRPGQPQVSLAAVQHRLGPQRWKQQRVRRRAGHGAGGLCRRLELDRRHSLGADHHTRRGTPLNRQHGRSDEPSARRAARPAPHPRDQPAAGRRRRRQPRARVRQHRRL